MAFLDDPAFDLFPLDDLDPLASFSPIEREDSTASRTDEDYAPQEKRDKKRRCSKVVNGKRIKHANGEISGPLHDRPPTIFSLSREECLTWTGEQYDQFVEDVSPFRPRTENEIEAIRYFSRMIKNREAAARSRQKRADRFEMLQREIERLKNEIGRLSEENARLRTCPART
jgi:hypothetical protein